MNTTLVRLLAALVIACVLSCHKDTAVVVEKPHRDIDTQTDSTTFIDITQSAGITWKHCCGADGRVLFPEAHGSGCAILDYDNDGWQDILILQSRHWPGHRTTPESTMVLYHNNHNGTFTDVTKHAGLDVPMMSMGCTVGDFDNDGWDDLYITNYGGNYLFRNDHGVFHDVTAHAGVAGYGRWSSSAMWIDYDNDGFLDLFVGTYVKWSQQSDVYCTADGKEKAICPPSSYPGDACQMFHNNRNGTFSDASAQTGIKNVLCKALGVMMVDYDEDGWTDILVANDLTPNRLFHNEHGVFKEIGVDAGVAYDESGTARAGMGIDWADCDRDGKPLVMIGNFTGEMDWVFKYKGAGSFIDRATADGIGTVSLPYNTFGLVMFDYDLDGWPDMFSVNGLVSKDDAIIRKTTYPMMSTLFRNGGDGTFDEVGVQYMKGPFAKMIVGRGCCYGDIDNDGSIDLLATANDDHPILMKCVRKNTNHWLRIKLQGVKSNRNGFGAIIHANVGNMKMTEMMKSGSSYQSANESVVTLGLGQMKQVDQLIVKWNCGTVDTLRNIPGDRMIRVVEGTGGMQVR